MASKGLGSALVAVVVRHNTGPTPSRSNGVPTILHRVLTEACCRARAGAGSTPLLFVFFASSGIALRRHTLPLAANIDHAGRRRHQASE